MNKKWAFLQLNTMDGAKTKFVLPFETIVYDPVINAFGDVSYSVKYNNKHYIIRDFYIADSEKVIVRKMYRILWGNITWHQKESNAPAYNSEILIKKSYTYIEKLKKLYIDLYPEVFI